MKLPILAAASLLATLSLPAAAADVGVSIGISQPGVYGRIDIGQFPQPQVVVTRPVLISPPRVVVAQPQPVYMWVPPGHRTDWRAHCSQYGACGVPVYFVQDGWYQEHVHKGKGKGHGNGNGNGKDNGKDNGKGKGHG